MLMATSSPQADIIGVLIGAIPAPMGTTSLLLLAACALTLIFRRSVSFVAFFTQLSVVTAFAYVYFEYDILAVLNMFAGSMFIFGLIFLSCVKRKPMRNNLSWFIFGVLSGIAYIVLAFYSKTENAVVFAVIIAAPFGVDLDRHSFSVADVLGGKNSALNFKIRSKFNKQLVNMNETLSILEDREKPEEREKSDK
jgi:electron transport complex protein RnfD